MERVLAALAFSAVMVGSAAALEAHVVEPVLMQLTCGFEAPAGRWVGCIRDRVLYMSLNASPDEAAFAADQLIRRGSSSCTREVERTAGKWLPLMRDSKTRCSR